MVRRHDIEEKDGRGNELLSYAKAGFRNGVANGVYRDSDYDEAGSLDEFKNDFANY